MWALYKKEISGFFSSLTGYVVILVFLLLNGLFMWVVPGQFNLLETGVASLDTMFAIAPWLYLFLVPAISMRTLAEEKRSGTLDLLLTRPVSEWQIVLAKFAAVWTLVLLSMVPTFLHLWSVYRLGSPPGNLDMGGSLGSYVGLFFLGGIYAAIGLFSSALTSNQVVSFLLAVVLSFLLYLGFGFSERFGGIGPACLFLFQNWGSGSITVP
ncbi:MAG: ABC transporter permease [Bacteroidales bacterium]